jgi:ubiquinone/menaquinone biosynthesis C-methylase UbiE
MSGEQYLHGYPPEEQERLYRQARFLEHAVYEHVDFTRQSHLIEVGCGVGAQTEILLERFPQLKIQGIDFASEQVERARTRLKDALSAGRVAFDIGDATKLPYPDSSFDGAWVTWFLEHVKEPVAALEEIRRVLRAGSPIYCTETMNACFFVHPYSPATLQYLFAYNDHQWNLGGDPFVGAKLANYLLAAGYQSVRTEVKFFHYDNRAPKKRAEMIDYWTHLLLSGAPNLMKAGRVTQETVDQMTEELERLKKDRDAVFFDAWIQARAQAL